MAIRDQIKKCARYTVMIVNIIFLACGIFILIMGLVGLNRISDYEDSVPILKELNIKLIASLIVCAGIATIAVAVIGFISAAFRMHAFLKAYTLLLFAVCCIQIAMGAYMITRDVEDLRDEWELDSEQGEARRQAYQLSFECCGFLYVTDSLPETECPNNYRVSCVEATKTKIEENLLPVAISAIVFGCLELISLVATCLIVCQPEAEKLDFYDNPFSY